MPNYNCELPKVRVYKGSRYIPVFADPLQWDKERSYEWLTVVYNCGRTYISKCPVPEGIDLPEYPVIANDYWALYADYNAQLELYRAEVRNFSTRYDEMFCWLKATLESEVERLDGRIDDVDARVTELDTKVENYYTEINNHFETFEEEVNNHFETIEQAIENILVLFGSAFSDLLNKIYLGGTLDSTGAIIWPTDDKIAIGNMNLYTGANNENYIRTAPDGDGDLRAE